MGLPAVAQTWIFIYTSVSGQMTNRAFTIDVASPDNVARTIASVMEQIQNSGDLDVTKTVCLCNTHDDTLIVFVVGGAITSIRI